jgi:hypothetical protein
MPPGDATEKAASGPRLAFVWFRVALGGAGLVVIVLIVRHAGAGNVLTTLRAAAPWLPVLCALELFRVGCETAASYLAFGASVGRIPGFTLFRAHVLGHSLSSVAPAPTVVNETIKATLLTPYVGAAAATSVGVINQVATLISGGLFSIPCGLAILALGGASPWFWACLVHAVVLVSCGLGLRAVTRARGAVRWLVRKFPRLAPRAEAFRDQASTTGLWAAGTAVEFFVSGIDVGQQWAKWASWAKVSDGQVSSDGATISTTAGQGLPVLANLAVRSR